MKTMKQGFTLIELMIVVAIIGILAAIAIPKFADLINKAKEGSTKGALSSVRSAIQVYYGDNEGWFPAVEAAPLTCLITNAKYMAEIPVAKMPGTTHGDVNTVSGALADATAGWLYFNDAASAVTWGNFVVNCTHEDIKGRSIAASTPWSTF